MAQQKKKKLIPVTDIIASSSSKKDQHRDDSVYDDESGVEVYDLKLEALRDFGKARPITEADDNYFDSTRKKEKVKTETIQQKNFSFIPRTTPRVRTRGYIWWWIGGSMALVAVVYAMITWLPRVTIAITAQKIPVTVSRQLTIVDAATSTQNNEIAGEVVTERKTNVFTFPATGTQTGSAKAHGTVIIFNNYNTVPQTLVATTRLQTPDGKIFRLDKRVVVPGGKKTGQVLEPGSVEAEVTADQAGSEFNIDPVDHFTIPGFQGSDKYNGFYATSLQPMSGGSKGEITIATPQDIDSAKKTAEARMKNSIISTVALKIPEGFTFIKDTQNFNVVTEKVDTRVDENKNFTVALEAESSVMTFKESDLRALLQGAARTQGNISQNYDEKEGTVSYASTTPDWDHHTIRTTVTYQGVFWYPIHIQELANRIVGENEDDLKSTILALPGIDRLTVSFWPFWVSHVPHTIDRVAIMVE